VAHLTEVESILREASRADAQTMRQIIAELRGQQHYSTATQIEIDGVIARYRASHPRKEQE